jgi:hypothetical protein
VSLLRWEHVKWPSLRPQPIFDVRSSFSKGANDRDGSYHRQVLAYQGIDFGRFNSLKVGEYLQTLPSFDKLGANLTKGVGFGLQIIQDVDFDRRKKRNVCDFPQYLSPVCDVSSSVRSSHEENSLDTLEGIRVTFAFMCND